MPLMVVYNCFIDYRHEREVVGQVTLLLMRARRLAQLIGSITLPLMVAYKCYIDYRDAPLARARR